MNDEKTVQAPYLVITVAVLCFSITVKAKPKCSLDLYSGVFGRVGIARVISTIICVRIKI